MELTRPQLATLIGFSASGIKDFENPNKVIDENTRKRYRMACAALALGLEFDWLSCTQVITRPIRIEFL